MNTKLQKEIVTIFIALLPFGYLAFLWNGAPDFVPIHWNITGKADKVASKANLILIPFALPVLSYLFFTAFPKFARTDIMRRMGEKYDRLKASFVIITSVIATYIIHMSLVNDEGSQNILLMLIGLLLTLSGNYFPVIPKNKFFGIRTPWTLKSDEIWNKTHKMAAKWWVIGGLCIVISSLIFSQTYSPLIFFGIIALISIVPIIYSYREYRKLKLNL